MSQFSPEELSALGLKPEEFSLISQKHPEIQELEFESMSRLSELAGDDFEQILELAPSIIDILTSPPQRNISSAPSESKITEMNDILENTIR